MTARQVFEGMLTELSKANAPSLLLHEFNYYFNKAINQYINKRYNLYDLNQQTTDDLRVLKATAILTPKEASAYNNYKEYGAGSSKLFGATYEVILPDDYLHMLNCVCIYQMRQTHKCYDKDDYVDFAATRLTADSWSKIVNDYYQRPTPERPYYYIHNVNVNETVPTNPLTEQNPYGTDLNVEYKVEPESVAKKTTIKTTWFKDNQYYIVENSTVYEAAGDSGDARYEIKKNSSGDPVKATNVSIDSLTKQIIEIPEPSPRVENSNFPRKIKLNNSRTVSTVEKDAGTRYGNASKVRCEIRYGRDNSVYRLDRVFIDYIKAPQVIRLTKEQVDLTEDTSQIMEFPDYVCQEIINELTTLVMARDGDPRLNVQTQVTQSIANPTQAQAPQQSAAKG